MGGTGQKPSNKQPKFLNLLILVHLKSYFIEVLNKFLMCFKINGLKNFKLITLMVFSLVPQLPILLYRSKNIKNSYNFYIYVLKFTRIHIIFIFMF